MSYNTHGGGASTNYNGLNFEKDTSLKNFLFAHKFVVDTRGCVSYDGRIIGFYLPKHDLYKWLKQYHPEYTYDNSKRYLPDECFVNTVTKEAIIIEKKFQNGEGSVDEKLTTCDFKKKVYQKMFRAIGYETIKYVFIFNDWFKQPVYADSLAYALSCGCSYFFNSPPLELFGLKIKNGNLLFPKNTWCHQMSEEKVERKRLEILNSNIDGEEIEKIENKPSFEVISLF